MVVIHKPRRGWRAQSYTAQADRSLKFLAITIVCASLLWQRMKPSVQWHCASWVCALPRAWHAGTERLSRM